MALAALGAGSGGVAWRSAQPFAPPVAAPSVATLATPVLSARRAPDLLARRVAERHLSAGLDAALGEAAGRSCLVVERAGRRLYARRPDEVLIPASNRKLLTAAAVLARLGPDARFATVARAQAAPRDGVVEGPLYLVGGGDPLLATADFAATARTQPAVRTPVEALVAALRAAGVREVRGPVVGDEGRYDAQRYVPTWKPSYVAAAESGPTSALVVNDGFAEFRPRRVAAPAPAQHAAAVVTTLLRASGVVVAAEAVAGSAPPGALEVARVDSPPVSEVVGEMLRESDNLTAELLTKELGYRVRGPGHGTTADGVAVTAETLAAAGLPAAGAVAADGSGLDRSNRATCGLLLATLVAAGPDGPLADGLAVAGRSGTLARRFSGGHPAAGRLRAKTGALDEVVGLSGWVDVAPDPDLAFSLLANALPSTAAGGALQERVGAELAAYPKAPGAAELGPRPPRPAAPAAP